MYRQATLGDVDFITGDYLAGMYKIDIYIGKVLLTIGRGEFGQ